MKTMTLLATVSLMLAGCSRHVETMEELTDRVFSIAQEQYKAMDENLTGTTMPRTAGKDGNLVTSDIRWWCSGFYPGSLWYIYEYTGDDAVKGLAEKNTWKLEPLKYTGTDHDLGFQMNCSFGNAYRITGDSVYLDPIRESASVLAARFSPVTGTIRSWDHTRPGCDWKYPVIIDNMMNLEHLYNAGLLFGIDTLKSVALIHANTTMTNHFRPDYSSWHLVDYDPLTGEVRLRQTVQGFSDSSSWARGQAWALYGYTMMYQYTGKDVYLAQAEKIADYLIPRLPEDGVPYWDYDSDLIPDDLRDASAGAIMVSALVRLSAYASEEKAAGYLGTAERIIRTLASDEYLAQPGEQCGFLLKHSVGNKPGNVEVDVPLTYADYYFLEALLRYREIPHKIYNDKN